MLRQEARQWDAIVVGGGLAGGAAACHLARAGKKTLLIEKQKHAHHKVCGEFLSFEAQQYLTELGIDAVRLGAVPLRFVRVHHGRRRARARLPFIGLSLSRFLMDEQLLAQAADYGATIHRGGKVSCITPAGEGWRVGAKDRFGAKADAVFLATGKHEFPALKRRPGTQNDFIGFKMHFACTRAQRQALAEHVEMILFNGGYAGLQLIEDGKANLCLVVTRQRFARIGRDWSRLLEYISGSCVAFREFVDHANPCWRRPAAITGLPYGFVHAGAGSEESEGADSIYRLGDQFAVIPSFCGEGMSIALHTARLAVSEFLIDGNRAPCFHARAFAELSPQIDVASLLGRAFDKPVVQSFGVAACRLFPGLISNVAARTRLRALA
ncbi:MAG: NAD(P)/FAD-dependent oxidoreductase [Gammaproteobacteria bacterium]|nr:FAD-dependent oxidoreductase [Gammaproteobacteria bacterium]MBA3731441.1 FAD-dependent oxidoreductase [Gammaproteobacteria bacterium]